MLRRTLASRVPRKSETAPWRGHHFYGRVIKGRKPGETMFFESLFQTDAVRQSFWVGDYKHKHLLKTGREHRGQVPASPAPGTFQALGPMHSKLHLGGHPVPTRESRHLPLMPVTNRSVFEHREEMTHDFNMKMRVDKKALHTAREVEFHQWYNQVQRVRGRWCRENGVTSRGSYTRAVDAAEYWD